jgi:hypothetical protein
LLCTLLAPWSLLDSIDFVLFLVGRSFDLIYFFYGKLAGKSMFWATTWGSRKVVGRGVERFVRFCVFSDVEPCVHWRRMWGYRWMFFWRLND